MLNTSKAVAVIIEEKINANIAWNFNRIMSTGVITLRHKTRNIKKIFNPNIENVSNSLNLNLEAPSKVINAKATMLVIIIKIEGISGISKRTIIALEIIPASRRNITFGILNLFDSIVARTPTRNMKTIIVRYVMASIK